jgi:cell division protein FtsZ
MTEKMAKFVSPKKTSAEIKVVGVGGGGGNAVNHMFRQGIKDVDFIICNTDSQALDASPVQIKVQLGASLTEGRGAGNKPEIGKKAAEENIEDVKKAFSDNTKMVFVTAGMGGGTGTGGAPVIAEACKKLGYLTVGIVTIPFKNEGRRRIKQAITGIEQLEGHVDALLIINNERIREMYGDFGISEAFARADNILGTAAKGIAEIITVPGYVNVDFSDVETVMRKSGLAVMGTGIAEGENRAQNAVENALNSPLLNNNDIRGAKNILIHMTSGKQEVTMDEVGQITDFVQNKAGFDADVIWGNGLEESLGNNLSVTIIATGFSRSSIPKITGNKNSEEEIHNLKTDTKEPVNKDTKKETWKTHTSSANQKTIEFNISEEKEQEDSDFEALYPRTSRERGNSNKGMSSLDYSEMSEEDLDEFENVPAFTRRHMRINDPKYKNKFSSISVTSSNRLTDKNSYLHDKVD